MGAKQKLNKAKNYLTNTYRNYLKKDVDEHAFLLEAGQGKNLNGNVFYLLKEIEENPLFRAYIPYFVVENTNREEAVNRFKFYGFEKVHPVVRHSREYKKHLATAKYLVTDNSFPAYFVKRKEQVYLNTWHGTPIKHLGKSDIENSSSLGNVQKNYFMADYALFPNDYTKDIFFSDYMLKEYFQNTILLSDYPRDEILRDSEKAQRLKKELGYEGKEVIAYMPTWRGMAREADAVKQIEQIKSYLNEIDENLEDSQIFMVNMHFLVNNSIDYSNFRHIVAFPGRYETYEILAISDMLITDYSSVFFDYGVSRKKTIIFAYDLQEYMLERGMYFDIRKLPFTLTENVEDLITAINDKTSFDYSEFYQKFCGYVKDDLARKILQLMISGDKSDLELRRNDEARKDTVIYNIGNIQNTDNQLKIQKKVMELEGDPATFIFPTRINAKTGGFLRTLPENITYVRVMPLMLGGILNKFSMVLYKKFGWCKNRAKRIFEFEKNRIFYHWEYKHIKNLNKNNTLLNRLVDYMGR